MTKMEGGPGAKTPINTIRDATKPIYTLTIMDIG